MTATAPVSPEAELLALRAALAEAGYPDAIVYYDPEAGEIAVRWRQGDVELVPRSVVWKALQIVGLVDACWPCWSARILLDDCDSIEPCAHGPWPEVVR